MTTHSEPGGRRPAQHGVRLSRRPRCPGRRARVPPKRSDATLELDNRAIRALQRGGDRLRMGYLLHTIAGALAATQPEAAAIIQGPAKPMWPSYRFSLRSA
jgi:hypothetical protein